MAAAMRGWQCVNGLIRSKTRHQVLVRPLRTLVTANAPIQLRAYQEECIQAVLTHLEQGHRRLGVSLATGSGKTVIFTHLIDRVVPPSEDAHQTLILVHRRELVEQAARHCINAYPTKTVEIEMGTHQASGAADITIASIQSLLSKSRLSKFQPERFKLLLVDEAHHIVAPGYLEVLKHFGLREANPTAHMALVGVSATLNRFDGLKLGAALDHIVYHKDYVDMIDDAWLSKVLFTTVRTSADLRQVQTAKSGDFALNALSEAVNTPEMNEVTVRAWLERARTRSSTLVFCVNIAHVVALTETFLRHGIAAKYVTGDDIARERDRKLEGFRKGDYRVLLNCGVFTEGTDIPNVDCVLLARPTKSRNLLVQMIGRGLRLHPEKENCHVIDMVAALGTGIVTTPTLMGLDPNELVEEASVDDMKELKERRTQEAPAANAVNDAPPGMLRSGPRSVTFTDYDNINDLIEDTSGERHIRAISHYAWIQVGDDRYVLEDKSGSYITIEREEDASNDSPGMYQVRYLQKLNFELPSDQKYRPYRRARVVSEGTPFLDAVHAADTLANDQFVRFMIAANAEWRKKPASENQVAFLNTKRDANDQLEPGSITKGQAASMITKLKFGARGRFDRIKQQARRIEAKASRDAKIGKRLSGTVRVGPVDDVVDMSSLRGNGKHLRDAG